MRIGIVPYINCRPLTAHLNCETITLPPRLLTDAVMNDEVDVALVPAFGIHKHELHAYPEAGLIGCDGPVKSVGFFLREGILSPRDIDSMYWDNDSQTSVELAKILFSELYRRNPRSVRSVPAENCREADAQLLIGDKALFFQEDSYSYWDLGEQWKELTGLGFLFACWASKRPLTPEEVSILTQAKKSGTASIEELIGDLPEPRREVAHRYLSQHIIYDATPTIVEGFERFKEVIASSQKESKIFAGVPFPEFEDATSVIGA